MKDAQPTSIYLKDYTVPDFLISQTQLQVDLFEEFTAVTAVLQIQRNPAASSNDVALVLHGEELDLQSVSVDGQLLSAEQFIVSAEDLTIPGLGESCVLTTVCHIKPQENTSLEGLYRSRTMYCTQCEAEGFRKITYYLDRPDILSEFKTTVSADKKAFPVLLSNGNLVDSGDLAEGRHFATWHDPFLKPAYLFALVAGDLSVKEDTFKTCSGRSIDLKIYVEQKDIDKCDHAMDSLKRAMRWDEEVYGREYDLDIFMIVAVDDFNMGAMENKGLNIFNTSCVLAKPETTTDLGFQRVEGVVAHEYFHNWSGNRVTCRDWFQLSLKEGFTVFRDSEFSADMGSRTVKRVEDVSLLRTLQFAEDAGPMAHPVRPSSFIEISNFYTLTVYEKGAEVVRMIYTLLGPDVFRQGSDLYFERHDGEAATIENFVSAMEDASGRDLTQFTRWYSQAGTPRVVASSEYDADANTYSLTFEQQLPDTPESLGKDKKPFLIPIALGLLGDAGNLPLYLLDEEADGESADNTSRVLEFNQPIQTFTFRDVHEEPIPVLLRGFSAPIKLRYDYSRDQLMAIMSRDQDGFCRWDASQQLSVMVLNDIMRAYRAGQDITVDSRLVEAFKILLADDSLDPAMVALMLQLPNEAYLVEISELADIDAIHFAKEHLAGYLSQVLESEFFTAYQRHHTTDSYKPDAESIAKRSLKNTALGYLSRLESTQYLSLIEQQFTTANNMTDQSAALNAVVNLPSQESNNLRQDMLDTFYKQWQHESLVINQWLQIQASCQRPGGLDRVKALMQHESFSIKNPNKVRAVIGAFCNNNFANFHDASGAGYTFLADQILFLNSINPQIAARQLTPLTKWRKYDVGRQQLIKGQLQRIMAEPDLSKDVYEVVSKSLKGV